MQKCTSECFLLYDFIIFTNGATHKHSYNVVAQQGGADFNCKRFPFIL